MHLGKRIRWRKLSLHICGNKVVWYSLENNLSMGDFELTTQQNFIQLPTLLQAHKSLCIWQKCTNWNYKAHYIIKTHNPGTDITVVCLSGSLIMRETLVWCMLLDNVGSDICFITAFKRKNSKSKIICGFLTTCELLVQLFPSVWAICPITPALIFYWSPNQNKWYITNLLLSDKLVKYNHYNNYYNLAIVVKTRKTNYATLIFPWMYV